MILSAIVLVDLKRFHEAVVKWSYCCWLEEGWMALLPEPNKYE
jgi:hypothetical protein